MAFMRLALHVGASKSGGGKVPDRQVGIIRRLWGTLFGIRWRFFGRNAHLRRLLHVFKRVTKGSPKALNPKGNLVITAFVHAAVQGKLCVET